MRHSRFFALRLSLWGDVGKADNQVVGKVLTVRFAGETTVAEVAIGTSNAEIKLHIKVQSRIDGIGLTSGDSITLNWRARECRLVLI